MGEPTEEGGSWSKETGKRSLRVRESKAKPHFRYPSFGKVRAVKKRKKKNADMIKGSRRNSVRFPRVVTKGNEAHVELIIKRNVGIGVIVVVQVLDATV